LVQGGGFVLLKPSDIVKTDEIKLRSGAISLVAAPLKLFYDLNNWPF